LAVDAHNVAALDLRKPVLRIIGKPKHFVPGFVGGLEHADLVGLLELVVV